MSDPLRHYREVWAVDFEFAAPTGERPRPLCVVARELRSGRVERRWLDGVDTPAPPYSTDAGTLFVAYYASAEMGCHLALDWPMPARILDLFVEFRCRTAGLSVPCGNGLLGALAYFGLPALDAADKQAMRELALRGGPYEDGERLALLDYCESDVDALARLLPAMLASIDLPRALLRGRYMAAAARMEWNGTPIDLEALDRLRANWETIKREIVATVNDRYGVFEPVRSRTLNPESTFGAAVLATASDWGLDPYHLADAVDYVWRQEREEVERTRDAVIAARRATGLTPRRLNAWEDAGHDHASWPGLDVDSRELAGLFPDLSIGEGYRDDVPDEDNSERLWNRLREPTPQAPPRHDADILRRAAEMVANAGPIPASDTPMRFSASRWGDYLARRGIPWPMLESGALALDDDTFREMAKRYPNEVGPMRELRHSLSQLKLNNLAVGSDGRNRCLLDHFDEDKKARRQPAFGSKTGRNQPSSSRSIFGPSTWLRSLIKPEAGRAVAYIDWEQQEFGIAGALSGDSAMMDAYRSGDPYLTFAKQASAVPADATKQSHKAEREQFKTCALAVQYGMSAESLARRLNVPPCRGRDLLRLHQQTYPTYWRWSDAVQDRAILTGRLSTVFGWTLHVGRDANPRSLRNFPMQASGSEMLRLACCLATERGIVVCAPVHDALLVEGPADEIDAVVEATQAAMREASEVVLPGFPLRTDAKIVRHPDRYSDPRGAAFWDTVWGLLDGETHITGDTGWDHPTRITGDTGGVSPVIPPPSLISCLIPTKGYP